MNNRNSNPKTLKEVEEMAVDTARKMVRDQTEWLDSVMKDLLPPPLYAVGKTGEDPDGKIAEYASKHQIQVIYVPDSLRIRVLLHGKLYAEFVPTFTVDGQPVKIEAQAAFNPEKN